MTDAPMRVTHLLKGLGPGGAERLVVAQASLDQRTDISHEVLYLLPHKDHLVAELREAGVDTTCLSSPRATDPRWALRLRRRLRHQPADILHVHSPAVAVVARLVLLTMPRRVRPALVHTEHNRWPRHHRLTRWTNRATIKLNDATIAVSDEVKSTIRGIRSTRVQTIVHGIDLSAVQSTADRSGVRDELAIAEDEILVVCVANLRREKALDVLIQAATQAHSEEPRLSFALVGQGPLEADVRAMAESSKLGDAFKVLGYRSDSTRIISGADIFTLSSRHEGLPVSVMEALALGVPVIATDAGGTSQAVGRAGVMVPTDDPEALANAYVELAGDNPRRSTLAGLATEEAGRFSAERSAAEIRLVYDEVSRSAADRPSSHS